MPWQRRDVLAGVGAVGLGTVLAGCSDDGGDETSPGDNTPTAEDSPEDDTETADDGGGGTTGQSRDCLPVSRFDFEFEEARDRLAVTLSAGQILHADQIYVRGDGFADVAGVDMAGPGVWSGDTDDGRVSGGNRLEIGATSDYRIALVLRQNGQDLGIIDSDTGPDADGSVEGLVASTPDLPECPLERSAQPPQASFDFQYDGSVGPSGTGRLTLTHAGGDSISPDRLSVRGDGFADVAGVDLTSAGNWPGSGEVSAGSSVTVGVRSDFVGSVVWEDDLSTELFRTYEGPDR